MNPQVLLHICCACCGTSVIEHLQQKGYSVIGYFFNPNIYPAEEYKKREDNLAALEKQYAIAIIREEYLPEAFDMIAAGLEQEKEGGERCAKCFHLRLKRAYLFAKKNNIPFFTSTLSVSTHKNYETIKDIGLSLNKDMFLAIDFKKDGGAKKSVDISKQLGLYRQKYCGCKFSI
jgi:predicted adenine nucleotide alpha hydrolase (AANH) superfamily ATPase